MVCGVLVPTSCTLEDCVKLTAWCGTAGDLPGSFAFTSLETQGKLFSEEDIFENIKLFSLAAPGSPRVLHVCSQITDRTKPSEAVTICEWQSCDNKSPLGTV